MLPKWLTLQLSNLVCFLKFYLIWSSFSHHQPLSSWNYFEPQSWSAYLWLYDDNPSNSQVIIPQLFETAWIHFSIMNCKFYIFLFLHLFSAPIFQEYFSASKRNQQRTWWLIWSSTALWYRKWNIPGDCLSNKLNAATQPTKIDRTSTLSRGLNSRDVY